MCKVRDKAIAAHQIVAKIADELVSGDNRGVLYGILPVAKNMYRRCDDGKRLSTKLRIIYVMKLV
jgi:hypothetical protein